MNGSELLLQALKQRALFKAAQNFTMAAEHSAANLRFHLRDRSFGEPAIDLGVFACRAVEGAQIEPAALPTFQKN